MTEAPLPERGMQARLLQAAASLRRGVLLVLIFVTPILVAYGSGLRDPFNTPKVALLIIGVSIVAAIRLAEVFLGAPLSGLQRLAVPALGFAVPLFLAWLASPDRGYSLSGADYGRYQGLVPYLLVVLLGVLVADAFAGRAHQLAWVLGVAGTIVAAYAIAQFLGFEIPGGPGGTRGFIAISTLGNPNFTGGFIAICLAAMAAFAFTEGPSGRVARVMAYIMAIGLGRSFTQGAWIAGIAGVAVAIGIVLVHRWSWSRVVGTVVAIMMALGSIFSVLLGLAGVDFRVLSTARSRGLTWETSIRAAAAKPLLGHGLNTFGAVQPLYRTEEAFADQKRRGSVPDDPHSVPLAMLVNGGVVVLLGFLAAIGWFFVQAVRVPTEDVTGAALVGAVTAYLTQALSSLDEVSLRVAFWVCLGGLAAARASGTETPFPKLAQRRFVVVRTLFGATLIAVAAVLSFQLAWHFLEVHRV